MDSTHVEGCEGMLEAYWSAVLNVGLYGPTLFSRFLKEFLDDVKEMQSDAVYHVIMILTDGDIHDMPETKDMIVELSKYPVSIIIIGLGEDDFGKMIELDGDDIDVWNQRGQAWERDIVQFVKFNEFRDRGFNSLSEEVLYEVPDQVGGYLEYMKKKGIRHEPRHDQAYNPN